jgi:hypothetical protein
MLIDEVVFMGRVFSREYIVSKMDATTNLTFVMFDRFGDVHGWSIFSREV